MVFEIKRSGEYETVEINRPIRVGWYLFLIEGRRHEVVAWLRAGDDFGYRSSYAVPADF